MRSRIKLGWNGLWVGEVGVRLEFVVSVLILVAVCVAVGSWLALLLLLLIPLSLLHAYSERRIDAKAGLGMCPRCKGSGKVAIPKGFPDTGPGEGGRRSKEQWLNAMQEDIGIIRTHVTGEFNDGKPSATDIAVALKEAHRLESDIRRFADEVHGISADDIRGVGPL